MHASELWACPSPKARLLRAALLPLSGLYALGWECYLGVYRIGLKRAQRPHRPVICVGNLVSGGSGKSPVTLHLADELRAMGREVVVSANGYGSPHQEGATLAPEGPLSAREWGDEPAMLRWLRPDLPLVVGRRRAIAAEVAHRHHPNAVLLLDDGFQHLPLAKDLTIVLDEPHPVNRWCLPAGPYREGRWNRRRADLLVPGRFAVETDPLRVVDSEGHPQALPDRFAALCALGRPDRFFAALGNRAEPALALPDHDALDAGNLLERLPTDRPTIVSAKDWVKLRERPDVGSRPIWIALHTVRLTPAGEFRRWLESGLDGL